MVLCGAGGAPPAGPALQAGTVVERDLKGGETHAYPVDLQAGQFLRVVVQEEGIAVVVRLLTPQDAEVTGVDSLMAGHSEEDLAVVAPASGLYRMEIRSTDRKAAPGRYRLRVEGPRPAGESDETRAEAVKAAWSAASEVKDDQDANRRRVQSLERALLLWRQLGEKRRTAETLFVLGYFRSSLPAGSEQAVTEFLESATLWESQSAPEARGWRFRSLNIAGTLLNHLGRPD